MLLVPHHHRLSKTRIVTVHHRRCTLSARSCSRSMACPRDHLAHLGEPFLQRDSSETDVTTAITTVLSRFGETAGDAMVPRHLAASGVAILKTIARWDMEVEGVRRCWIG
jgi:hypothetical protein